MYLQFLFSFCALPLVLAQPQHIYRKFLYKHSFRGPVLAQRDGTIPFWEIVGDAIASSEQLRLAPSMRSKQGAAWNSRAMTDSEFWEVEFTFKVTGQGRIGADGLAFWFTANKGSLGPVFGSNDYWTGLGLFFDSFDNDAQKNNPYIMMMINDGTRSYDHQSDGSNQMLAGCQKDFRNRPFPVKIKIEYLKNVISVLVHDGMSSNERYELCIRAENVFLPRNGYFGLSAATGGLADDHDVLSFSVYSFATTQPQPPAMLPKDEQKKFEEEFERQRQQFEQEREKFQKEHPDKVKPPAEEDIAKYYEDATQRELRLIYEGQTTIHTTVQQLDGKLNQILQAQNQISHSLGQIPGGTATGGAGGGVGVPVDTFQRHEVNEALQLSREMATTIRELRSYITDIHSKASNLEQRVTAGGGGGGDHQGGGADQFQFQTVKSYLEGIKHDVEQVRTNARQNVPCPTVDSNCLSPTLFIVIIVAQSLTFFLLSILKGRGEKAKFY